MIINITKNSKSTVFQGHQDLTLSFFIRKFFCLVWVFFLFLFKGVGSFFQAAEIFALKDADKEENPEITFLFGGRSEGVR